MSLDIPALRRARDDFNAAMPLDTAVIVRQPGMDEIITNIRGAAVLMGSGKVQVWVYALTGAVPIEWVHPAPVEAIPLTAALACSPSGRERPWTPPEDVVLLAGRATGRSYLQIANSLGRSAKVCSSRYARLTGKDGETAA